MGGRLIHEVDLYTSKYGKHISEISEDDIDTLLERAKSCPTRDTKDDLLDTIANDLNADEQTDQDVSDKLAKLINKRWSEKLNSDKLSEEFLTFPTREPW